MYTILTFFSEILANAHSNQEFVLLFFAIVAMFVVMVVAFIQALAAFERLIMRFIDL